jgi:hypothetical protein
MFIFLEHFPPMPRVGYFPAADTAGQTSTRPSSSSPCHLAIGGRCLDLCVHILTIAFSASSHLSFKVSPRHATRVRSKLWSSKTPTTRRKLPKLAPPGTAKFPNDSIAAIRQQQITIHNSAPVVAASATHTSPAPIFQPSYCLLSCLAVITTHRVGPPTVLEFVVFINN